jgi:hypothetical protein
MQVSWKNGHEGARISYQDSLFLSAKFLDVGKTRGIEKISTNAIAYGHPFAYPLSEISVRELLFFGFQQLFSVTRYHRLSAFAVFLTSPLLIAAQHRPTGIVTVSRGGSCSCDAPRFAK